MAEQDTNHFASEDEDIGRDADSSEGQLAFRKIPRELTEEELASTAAQKLLVGMLDQSKKEKEEYKNQLKKEKEEYKIYVERFHKADKKVAVLEEKGKTKLALEILSGTCLTFGGLAIGQISPLWQDQPSGWIVGVLGLGFLVGGIYAKKVKAL